MLEGDLKMGPQDAGPGFWMYVGLRTVIGVDTSDDL